MACEKARDVVQLVVAAVFAAAIANESKRKYKMAGDRRGAISQTSVFDTPVHPFSAVGDGETHCFSICFWHLLLTYVHTVSIRRDTPLRASAIGGAPVASSMGSYGGGYSSTSIGAGSVYGSAQTGTPSQANTSSYLPSFFMGTPAAQVWESRVV